LNDIEKGGVRDGVAYQRLRVSVKELKLLTNSVRGEHPPTVVKRDRGGEKKEEGTRLSKVQVRR